MRARISYSVICAAIVLAVMVIVLPIKPAVAQVDENMCKQMYERYLELGEQKFREKYAAKSYTNDCIKLYKNSNWTFAGKAKIDSNFAKIVALKNTPITKKIDVKIISEIPIGPQRFLVKFRMCSDDLSINQPTFLIQSTIDQYLGVSAKILHKGKCNDYASQVMAKQKTDIKIENILDLSKYKNLKTKAL